MSDFLNNLLTRSLATGPVVRPRLPSRFEPATPYAGLFADASRDWHIDPGDPAEEASAEDGDRRVAEPRNQREDEGPHSPRQPETQRFDAGDSDRVRAPFQAHASRPPAVTHMPVNEMPVNAVPASDRREETVRPWQDVLTETDYDERLPFPERNERVSADSVRADRASRPEPRISQPSHESVPVNAEPVNAVPISDRRATTVRSWRDAPDEADYDAQPSIPVRKESVPADNVRTDETFRQQPPVASHEYMPDRESVQLPPQRVPASRSPQSSREAPPAFETISSRLTSQAAPAAPRMPSLESAPAESGHGRAFDELVDPVIVRGRIAAISDRFTAPARHDAFDTSEQGRTQPGATGRDLSSRMPAEPEPSRKLPLPLAVATAPEHPRTSRFQRNIPPTPPVNSQEPNIQVTIGRIEVRAVSTQTSRPKEQSASPVMSLNDYLRQRSRRGGV